MKSMPASDNNFDSDSQRENDADRVPAFSPKRLIPLSPNARRNRDLKETRIGWKMAALGWEFSSQVVAGVALGWGVDYFFPTNVSFLQVAIAPRGGRKRNQSLGGKWRKTRRFELIA